jgi:hypothetical protein
MTTTTYAADRTGLKKIMGTNVTNEKLIAVIGATGQQGGARTGGAFDVYRLREVHDLLSRTGGSTEPRGTL